MHSNKHIWQLLSISLKFHLSSAAAGVDRRILRTLFRRDWLTLAIEKVIQNTLKSYYISISILQQCIVGIIVISFSLISLQCIQSPSKPVDVLVNPVDPESPVFTLPKTTIINAPDPSVALTVPQATIIVKGNISAIEFSYKLDAYDWSPWDSSTTIVLTDLDEGTHHCTVRALHLDKTTIEANPPSVDFTVHAVTGTALMFSSRKIVVSVGSSFNYYIVAYQVQNLYGANIVFSYDNTAIQINSISSVTIANANVQLLAMQYSNEAKMDVFFTNAGSVNGITGSDSIIVLNCTALKSATSILTFLTDSVQFRDANNTQITINQIVNGKVVAQ